MRQATTPSSRIIDALTGLRALTGVAVEAPVRLGHVLMGARRLLGRPGQDRPRAGAWAGPIPRLQRPGSGSSTNEYPRFLYDDHNFASEKGWLRRGEAPVVRLLPGVADALARRPCSALPRARTCG